MGTPPGTWAATGIHAKALWTLQVSMTALSGDITLPLVSRWFGTSRGLGEGRLSTPVGYPLRQPWTKKHTAKRVCVSVTVPALGAGPGPVLAADGRCAAYARRRWAAHVEYPEPVRTAALGAAATKEALD